MKYLFLLLLPASIYCELPSAKKLLNSAERGEQVEQLFNLSDSYSVEDACLLFEKTKKLVEIKYGCEISLEEVKEIACSIFLENGALHEESEKLSELLNLIFIREDYHSVLSQKDSNTLPLQNLKKEKNKSNSPKSDKEIPGTVIIGAVEVLAGALIWIVPPFRIIGSGMIMDGTRRLLDEAQEKDKNRKKEQM